MFKELTLPGLIIAVILGFLIFTNQSEPQISQEVNERRQLLAQYDHGMGGHGGSGGSSGGGTASKRETYVTAAQDRQAHLWEVQNVAIPKLKTDISEIARSNPGFYANLVDCIKNLTFPGGTPSFSAPQNVEQSETNARTLDLTLQLGHFLIRAIANPASQLNLSRWYMENVPTIENYQQIETLNNICRNFLNSRAGTATFDDYKTLITKTINELGTALPKASTLVPQCRDGADNDGDGLIDRGIDLAGKDPGCATADDDNEINPQCNNSLDDDGDGRIDSADPACRDHPTDPKKYLPDKDNESDDPKTPLQLFEEKLPLKDSDTASVDFFKKNILGPVSKMGPKKGDNIEVLLKKGELAKATKLLEGYLIYLCGEANKKNATPEGCPDLIKAGANGIWDSHDQKAFFSALVKPAQVKKK